MNIKTRVGQIEDVFVYDGDPIEENFSLEDLGQIVDNERLMRKYLERNHLDVDFYNWLKKIENVDVSEFIAVENNTVAIEDAVYLEDEKRWILDLPTEEFYYDSYKEVYVRKFENLSEQAKEDYNAGK